MNTGSRRLFKKKNGFSLLEVVLVIFIFSSFLLMILQFIRANQKIYDRKSEEFINKVSFLKIRNIMENDFSNIQKMISYDSRTGEIRFLVKNNETEEVVAYRP
ncbi:MAG: prepilin-type N-terminal cleavage/methylation domain-containing protein, partial [bacterium]|nr:prepilin-type N-terminal cleavage/methylation domain-containing protein [bacterium]